MYLEEYQLFENWYTYTTRKGVLTFGFPKVNDNSGNIREYRFTPGSRLSVSNPGGLVVDVSMQWEEA
jgi:hypothetical protein